MEPFHPGRQTFEPSFGSQLKCPCVESSFGVQDVLQSRPKYLGAQYALKYKKIKIFISILGKGFKLSLGSKIYEFDSS